MGNANALAVPFVVHQAALTTHRNDSGTKLFVVHETASVWPGDENFLAGGPRSVNWFIRPDGTLVAMTPPDTQGRTLATAHAGICAWTMPGFSKGPNDGRFGINPSTGKRELLWGWANLWSEGVEVSGLNTGKPFTPAQITTLIRLTKWRMAVHALSPDQVVRHADIAYPKEPPRKTDPKGIDWAWFKQQLAPGAQAAPPTAKLKGGNGEAYEVPADVVTFYDGHGGILPFGLPTGPAFQSTDSAGEVCTYVPLETGFLKIKPSMPEGWRIRMAPLSEVVNLLNQGYP